MAIVVVGGSGKDVGKTALVCAIISALRDYDWTAVKITAHDYGSLQDHEDRSKPIVQEETSAAEDTDTARYLAAGARRALLVTRSGLAVPIDSIRNAIGSDRNIIFESNRIVDYVTPDVCLALIGGIDIKQSFEHLACTADAFVTSQTSVLESLPAGPPHFHLDSIDRLTEDFVAWLRTRLIQVSTSQAGT